MNRLLLTIGTLFFLVACGGNQPMEKQEEVTALPSQYYYYPKANVYFDSANKEYLFQSNDSLTWQTAKQIPAVMQVMMDKAVFIQNPPDPVWKDNEAHKLVYSAVLYATPSDTVAKKVEKPLPKPPVPVVDSTVTVEKKERKGLGKLLDKIFGRNKDKKKKEQEQADSAQQKH